MTVHSTQLGAHQTIGTGGVTIYTVPANKRAIVKSIWIRNTAGAAQTAAFALILTGGATITIFQPLAASPAAGSSLYLDLWVILNAGDALKITAGAASLDAIVSGTELSTL